MISQIKLLYFLHEWMGQKGVWSISLSSKLQVSYALLSNSHFENSVWGWKVGVGDRNRRWGQEYGNVEWRKKARGRLGCGSPLAFLHWILKSPLECFSSEDSFPEYLGFLQSAHFWGNLIGLGGFSYHAYACDTQLYNAGPDISYECKTCVSNCLWT